MARSKTAGIFTDADGNKIINKQFKGERIYIRLGRASQQEAERRLAHELEERRQALDYGTRPCRTFADAARKYLTEYAIKKSRDGEDDARFVLQLTPFIGTLELHQIHDGTLAPFIAQRQRDGVSNQTIKHALQTVRRILNLATRSWRHEHSGKTWLEAAPLITMPDCSKAREPYPISWSEQKLLLSELPLHLQNMLLFKVNTGTREQEVCKLRWDWEAPVPELDTSVFIVPSRFGGRHENSGVKNRQDRLIVLNEVAKSVLESCRGAHPIYVFTWIKGLTGKARPLNSMNNTAWWEAVERATERYQAELGEAPPDGFTRLRVHDLKHTFGRRLRAAGVPLETRRVLLGHRTQDITTHYSAAELLERITAANKVSNIRTTPTLTLLRTRMPKS